MFRCSRISMVRIGKSEAYSAGSFFPSKRCPKGRQGKRGRGRCLALIWFFFYSGVIKRGENIFTDIETKTFLACGEKNACGTCAKAHLTGALEHWGGGGKRCTATSATQGCRSEAITGRGMQIIRAQRPCTGTPWAAWPFP